MLSEELENTLKNYSEEELDVLEEQLKAVWTTATINDFPDSSFGYVESGEKDKEGKTVPRSRRHLPYKDKNGKIDAAHVRNALARLPQTNIPEDAKASARRKLVAAAKQVGVEVSEKSVDYPFTLVGLVQKARGKDKEFYIYGYASIDGVDVEGDRIPRDALEKALPAFMASGYNLLMFEHTDMPVGRAVSQIEDEQGHVLKTQVDDKGLFIVAHIRQDLSASKSIIEKIESGEYNSFSIAGKATVPPVEKEGDNGMVYRFFPSIELIEISLCHKGINQGSNPPFNKFGYVYLSDSSGKPIFLVDRNKSESFNLTDKFYEKRETLINKDNVIHNDSMSDNVDVEGLKTRISALEKQLAEKTVKSFSVEELQAEVDARKSSIESEDAKIVERLLPKIQAALAKGAEPPMVTKSDKDAPVASTVSTPSRKNFLDDVVKRVEGGEKLLSSEVA